MAPVTTDLCRLVWRQEYRDQNSNIDDGLLEKCKHYTQTTSSPFETTPSDAIYESTEDNLYWLLSIPTTLLVAFIIW